MNKKQKYGKVLLAAWLSGGFWMMSSDVVLAAPEAPEASTAGTPAGPVDYTGRTISAVKIHGNQVIKDSELLPYIQVKPGDAWKSVSIQTDLKALYESGWFADVTATFVEAPEGVQVVYVLRENPVLNKVNIVGNTKIATEKLRALLTVPEGKVLNAKQLQDNAAAIEELYKTEGYILAKVSDLSLDKDGVLKVSINEGVVEDIIVKGNEKTKSYVVTREMKLKKNEPFNSKLAKRSLQRIYNLGFFEDVNFKLNPGREPNAVIIEIDVVEQKTGVFTIGAGYSKTDGTIGILEVGDNNFRGTGDKIKIHWEIGGKGARNTNRKNRNYEFSYTRPWVDDKETSLSFSVYDMTNEYTDYYDNTDTERSTYDKRRKGVEVTLGRPEGEFVRKYITLKHRTDTYMGYEEGPVDYQASPGTEHYDPEFNSAYLGRNYGTTNSVTLQRVFDNRDNIFNATEGRRFSVSSEFAGLGGDFSFKKYSTELRTYRKVGRDHVLAFRGMAGWANGELPDSQRFALGGSDSLRGYLDDQFKGNKMWATSLEYRFPVAQKVYGIVFSDAGRAWSGIGGDNSWKKSFGVGVRMNTPLGAIRLDYGKGDESGRFHFSFGGQF